MQQHAKTVLPGAVRALLCSVAADVAALGLCDVCLVLLRALAFASTELQLRVCEKRRLNFCGRSLCESAGRAVRVTCIPNDGPSAACPAAAA